MTQSATLTASAWLEKLLSLMGLETRVLAQDLADNHQWLEIDAQPFSPEIGEALLGKEGTTLDSLQFLVNTHFNLDRPEGQEYAYTVELLGFRAQRHRELLTMAETAVAAVRTTGQEYVFGALRAAERRQLHQILSSETELFTFSRGKEPERFLVLSPQAEALPEMS